MSLAMEAAGYLTIAEAARRFPSGRGRHLTVKAVRSRIRQGVGGVRLRAEYDGRSYLIRPEWIEEFVTEVTRRRLANPVAPPRADAEAAARLKERHGIDT